MTEIRVFHDAAAEGATQAGFDLDSLLSRVAAAQKRYASYDQERVDAIFKAAAMAANAARIELAKDAVAETGMGVVEDKVIKNHFASEYIYHKYRDEKTCGIVERDPAGGVVKIAEPIGVIAGVIPTTNPTSTAIFKTLLALKTRNGIVISPHPRAKACTVKAVRIVLEAAVAAGAPADIAGWIPDPTVELSAALMRHPKVDLILATGGPGMVKAAYSSGKPALGVGPGNTPVVVDESADIPMAAASIILSKTFDNGMICASEQAVVAVDAVYETLVAEFKRTGARILSAKEKAKLGAVLIKDGRVSADIVGQPATRIAAMAGFEVPADTKILVVEAEKVGAEEPFSQEKLSPVLALYRAADYAAAENRAEELLNLGGLGHTAALYTDPANRARIEGFGDRMKASRVLVNMPTSQGAIGDVYNFRLAPSLTLGCGSWGGNTVSENVGVKHLLNVKTVADRKENMLWFRVPPKVYLKPGCLELALLELADKKRAFLVTDGPLFALGMAKRVTDVLERLGIAVEVFHDVQPDPTFEAVDKGLERMAAFKPDLVIALGGGSPIDAAKIMRLKYEHPEADYADLAMRFMDIRKRICEFPALGKLSFVAIPTTSGTGSEVTPFAVVTDGKTGKKYPIADYALTPDMAIVDADLCLNMPRGLTAASGIDALTHALEALVSVMATDFTTPHALEAARLVFAHLPDAVNKGAAAPAAREGMHHASAMAGMAFANAFLGVCHSMAHKLGAAYHIPHGVANALLIGHVIRYNAQAVPTKQAAFPQYRKHEAAARYARMADYLGLGGGTEAEKVERLIQAVEALKAAIGIPASIREAGVDEAAFLARLDSLAEEAFDDQCTGANPRYPLIAEIKELYRKAYYGEKA